MWGENCILEWLPKTLHSYTLGFHSPLPFQDPSFTPLVVVSCALVLASAQMSFSAWSAH